jgi:hypothetical protein
MSAEPPIMSFCSTFVGRTTVTMQPEDSEPRVDNMHTFGVHSLEARLRSTQVGDGIGDETFVVVFGELVVQCRQSGDYLIWLYIVPLLVVDCSAGVDIVAVLCWPRSIFENANKRAEIPSLSRSPSAPSLSKTDLSDLTMIDAPQAASIATYLCLSCVSHLKTHPIHLNTGTVDILTLGWWPGQ